LGYPIEFGPFTAEEIRVIAARASLPEERNDPRWIPDDDPGRAERGARWRSAVAKGNEEVFARVMAWRGIDTAARARAMAPVRLAPGAPLPDWVTGFSALLGAFDAGSPDERLLVRFARGVIAGVWDEASTAGLAPEARASLEAGMATTVGEVLGTAIAKLEPPGPRELFLACPVLARLLVLAVERRLAAIRETLAWIRADRDEVVRVLFGGRDTGPVVELINENADPHDGGRRVTIVVFANGDRVVLKPRSPRVDAAFAAVARALADEKGEAPARAPRVLDRGDRGWAEFVTHRSVPDDDAEAAFYRRCGGLLALAHALDAVDLHYENLIADGTGPVPVDLETALLPGIDDPVDEMKLFQSASGRAVGALTLGVTRTALLPLWMEVSGIVVDMGGFGDPGRPGMNGRHRPSGGFIEDVLARHAETLFDSFSDVYRRILARRNEIAAPGGALEALRGARLRYIFRDTRIYARLLRASLAPAATVDAAERDIVLERLARVLCVSDERPPHLPFVEADIRALRELDIPRYGVPADERGISDARGLVATIPEGADALSRARSRIAGLSEDNLAIQEGVARMTLQARVAAPFEDLGLDAPPEDGPEDPAVLVAAAVAAGRALVRRAHVDEDGAAAWITLRLLPKRDLLTPTATDGSPGFGAIGLARLFAALARVDDSERWGDWARATVLPIATHAFDILPAERYREVRRDPGLLAGLAGTVLGLAEIGRDLELPELVETARRMARERLSRMDGRGDATILTGGAGLILGLLRLDRVSPDLGAIEWAVAAGHVLEREATTGALVAMGAGRRSGGPTRGASGPALAATELARRTGDQRWADLAARALAVVPAPTTDWCPVWAGDGGDLAVRLLARRAGIDLPAFEPPERIVGVERMGDNVIQGRAGAAEVLSIAARLLDRPEWDRLAGTLLTDAARRLIRGETRLFRRDVRGGDPSTLLHGTPGSAYRFLQRAAGGASGLPLGSVLFGELRP